MKFGKNRYIAITFVFFFVLFLNLRKRMATGIIRETQYYGDEPTTTLHTQYLTIMQAVNIQLQTPKPGKHLFTTLGIKLTTPIYSIKKTKVYTFPMNKS